MDRKNFFKKYSCSSAFLTFILIALMTGPALLFSTRGPEICLSRLSEEKGPEVRWYIISLGPQKIGYIKETVEKIQEDGLWNFKNRTESKMVFNRLGKKVELIFNSEYVESEDGHLIKVFSDQLLSSQPMKIEAWVQEGKVVVKSTAGGRTFSRELPYSGKLLGPQGIGRLTESGLKKPGDKIEFKTLLAELSQVASGERTLIGEEEIEFRGQKLKARRIEEKFNGLATTRKLWLDDRGSEIRSIEPSPFGDLVTELSTEQEAIAGMEGLNLNQDQYRISLIKANIRLPQARQLDRVVIRLKHKRPELGWPDFQNDYQRIIHQDKDSLVMELKRVEMKTGIKAQKKLSEQDLLPYLKANAYIAPEDPEIKKVAQEVAGSENDVFKKALKLRDWVSRNMNFDLGIVFAPASEIIKSKRGTCAGYAALLASLLRSAGIPSRYLFGLVYAQGIWGGHAWVEAWIDGQWVPLDAAVPSPGVADPARLAIAWSSLDEGLGESLSAAQKVFGNVEIEIQEYSFRGKTFKIEPGSPVYEVKNNVYHNPGLKLSLKAPAGFTFADLDKVWPDETVLTLTGPSGQLVKLIQGSWFPADNLEQHLISLLRKEVKDGKLEYVKIWGKKRPILVSAEKSAVAIVNGVDVFILTARSQKSEELLRTVLKNFRNTLEVD